MKKKIKNAAIAAVAVGIVAAVIAYNYSADQTRQRGLQFGTELEQIQQEVKDIQTRFYSEKTKWEEGDITKEELLEFYDTHLDEFGQVITRYDRLDPPEIFEGSVELLRLSSATQLSSDSEYIRWIETGDGSAKVRSDSQFQESVEYELQGTGRVLLGKDGSQKL